jgi:hypothetical protein
MALQFIPAAGWVFPRASEYLQAYTALMQQTCRQCKSPFDISPEDIAFYDSVSPVFAGKKESIPTPTLCPDCRLKRRLVFRNQLFVYQRPSSVTKKTIFSRFPADVPFPVFENEEWYGGSWDGLTYGQAFDVKQSFFPQLQALRDKVPHRTLSLHQSENCDYCNNDTGIRNCYLVFNSTGTEDSMYCENCVKAKDCLDCTYCPTSELCYDCTMCEHCYRLQSSEFCENCSDSSFLSHCYSCKDCFGCINLSHKQFCAFNKQYSEQEYRKLLTAFDPSSWKSRNETAKHCRAVWASHPRPHGIIHNSENVSGNHILNSKNVQNSFFIQNCEDLRYCLSLYENVRSSYDFSFFGRNCELMYEVVQCGINDSNVLFSFDCWGGNSNLLYSWMCESCQNCFGCVGLQKKRYCILNKQYTKEDYERLVPQVIAKMRADGEWGEFFPMSLSPFPYNHSAAQRYFPLSSAEAKRVGCSWYSREIENAHEAISAASLPDSLPAADESFIVKSEQSGRAFRITTQEIKRYRQMQVPLPRKTYDERMEERSALLGGIKLYERTCDKSKQPLLTTFPPDTPFPVWHRDVYNQEFRG